MARGTRAGGPHLHARLAEAVERRDLDTALACAWTLYQGAFWSLGRSMGLRDEEIEERLQDGVARAARQWPAFEGDAFGPWLVTLVRYELLSGRRATGRRAAREGTGVTGGRAHCTPEDEVAAAESLLAVEAVKAGLDPVGARVFEALAEDLPDEALAAEITRSLGVTMSPHAVQARRYRLRQAIARALADRSEP